MGLGAINYEDFKIRMESPENREVFWNTVSPLTENLGTLEEFEDLLADKTPLNREPVEIPTDVPQNQQDYVNLEKPIEDEKLGRIKEQGFQDVKIEGLPEPEFIARIPEDKPKAREFNTFFDQAVLQPFYSIAAGSQVGAAGILDILDQWSRYGERITDGKIKRG